MYIYIWLLLLLSSRLSQGIGGAAGPLGPPGPPGLPVSLLLIQSVIRILHCSLNDFVKLLSLCPFSCRVLKDPREPKVQLWVESIFFEVYHHADDNNKVCMLKICFMFFPGPCWPKRRHWYSWSSWSSCEYLRPLLLHLFPLSNTIPTQSDRHIRI